MVGWPYRQFVDPFQLAPGVGPADGDAEAVVRGGRIAVLSLVQAPASVRQQGSEVAAAVRAAATQRAAVAGGIGPDAHPRRPLRGAADPADAAWPLALGGLALLAAGTAARRRRRALP